jgi:hypothetical protein
LGRRPYRTPHTGSDPEPDADPACKRGAAPARPDTAPLTPTDTEIPIAARAGGLRVIQPIEGGLPGTLAR